MSGTKNAQARPDSRKKESVSRRQEWEAENTRWGAQVNRFIGMEFVFLLFSPLFHK